MRPVSDRSLPMSIASSPSLPRTMGSDSSSSPMRSVAVSVLAGESAVLAQDHDALGRYLGV